MTGVQTCALPISTVLIARAYGARRQRDCRHIAEQTLASELILVLGVQLVLLLQGPRILRFFSEDGAVLALAGDYLHIILSYGSNAFAAYQLGI